MKLPIPDNDDEPEPICGNCEYWVGDLDGQKICFHKLSPHGATPVTAEQSCKKFFPNFEALRGRRSWISTLKGNLMTLEDAIKVAKIIGTADGACSNCVGDLLKQIMVAFPEFEWIKGADVIEYFHYDGSLATEGNSDFSQRRIGIDVTPMASAQPNQQGERGAT